MYPWIRFWARLFDYFILFNLFALVLNIVAPVWRETAYWQALWLSFVAITVWVPIEAYMLHRFQMTPGKALLHLSLHWHDRPAFANTIKRSASVWLWGMGCGIPILYLIFPILSYIHMVKHGTTKWDETCHTRVLHQPISGMRVLSYILLLIVMDIVGFRMISDFAWNFLLMEETYLPFPE